MEKVRKLNKKEKRWESKKRKVNAFLQLLDMPVNDMFPENRSDSVEGNSVAVKTNEINSESSIQEQKMLRDKLRQAKDLKGPELKLNKDGFNAQLFVYPEGGIFRCSSPIFTDDIKQFLILLTQNTFCNTRWCKVTRCQRISQVVLLIINGLSADHYCQNIDCFPKTKRLPLHLFEVVPPASYGINIIDALCFCPTNCRNNNQEPSVLNGKVENNYVETVKKVEFQAVSKISLLLSPTQMIMEQYPLPFDNSFKDYCFTKVRYKDVCPSSPLYALDCEMVMTTENKLEVARVSIVDENLKVIYDSYVLPNAPVVDYLTKFSGITKATLKDVKMTLKDVQQNIQQLLPPDAILCGQSLNYDFHALKIIHPYVIDTSVIYNLSGARWKKTSLKNLSRKFLGEEIQCGENGHSPIEDSKTTMKLVLLKLKHGLEFGDAVLSNKLNKTQNILNTPNPVISKNGSKCIVGNDLILNWYLRQQIQVVRLIKTENNKQTRKVMIKEISQHYFTVCLLNVKRDVITDFINSLKDIDKTINKIYEECAENALFVVATSGCFDETSYRYQNGLCMLKFKT